MSAPAIRRKPLFSGAQRGAALLVILAIIGLGALYFLVSNLNRATLAIGQAQKTSDALARAKEALIGRAAADDNRPGSLPCPDTDNDGIAEIFAGTDCPSYIGRLPWRTLGLEDLRDSAGERLWYALSPNFRDHAAGGPLNSDTQGQLTVDGTANIAAIILAPGSALLQQVRDAANQNNAANYLEGDNANGDTVYTAQTSDSLNDRLLAVAPVDIFSVVDRRIAREARNCLEGYAAGAGGRYPWAAPLDPALPPTYVSVTNTLFGRIPISSPGGGGGANLRQDLQDATAEMSAALDAFRTDPSQQTAQDLAAAAAGLQRAANGIQQAAQQVSADAQATRDAADAARTAADRARRNLTPANIDAAIAAANSALAAANTLAGSMQQTGLARYLPSLQSAIDDLAAALGAFEAAPSAGTARALSNAANALSDTANQIRRNADSMAAAAIATENAAATAEARANAAAASLTRGNIRSAERAARRAITSANRLDRRMRGTTTGAGGSMPNTWPTGCFSQPYWADWQESVFYQIDADYSPSGSATNPGSLTINGAGSYKLVTIVAGRALGQGRTTNADKGDIFNYLEGGNAHATRNNPGTNPVTTFFHNPVSTSFNDQIAQ